MEDRKVRKPLMEKKRRARINESLEVLKRILMEVDPQSVNKKNAKLEKADILEMTVRYLQTLQRKPAAPQRFENFPSNYHYGRNYPMRPFNSSGGQFFYNTYERNEPQCSRPSRQCQGEDGGVWRPW